jgi:hypothetical protein
MARARPKLAAATNKTAIDLLPHENRFHRAGLRVLNVHKMCHSTDVNYSEQSNSEQF